MKRSFSFFLTFCFSASLVVGAEAPAPRPNILYLYVDDMGWGSLGPNAQWDRKENGLPYVRTPNLDELASRGVNFTRAYGCTVCSPARSSQQTGFHQGHTFADRNDPDNAKKAMRADDVLMGDVLSKAGYATGYWGKWGYGGSKDMKNPTIDNVQTLPTSHGYEHVLTELHHVRAHTFFQPTLWSAPAKPGAIGGLELVPNSIAKYAGKSEFPKEPALQEHSDYPEVAYCDDAYCFAALEFVRAQAKKYGKSGRPFFGLLAVQVPHAPFGEIEELPEWDKAYKGVADFASLKDQTKQWAAMVTRIDGHFGNILKALKDPNGDGDFSDSVVDNTLVVFQSDNGGPGGPCNIELNANGGLRGNKGSIYEGGIRVPTLMSWPKKMVGNAALKPSTSSDRVIDVSDLLPTFCELAGVAVPVGLDGVSLAPVLTGEGERRTREFLIHEAGNSASIIRGKDKLIRSGKKGDLVLYDLEADPIESDDLAKANPKLVAELKGLLLGERVTEPRGFANTYHRWTGGNGAMTSDPDNWSDYVYSNAGIEYKKDTGAPQLSWSALIENSEESPNSAKADQDLEFLGLEIRGGKGTQELILGKGVGLTARNELRLSENAVLTVNGGTVTSLRWVDVKPGARVRGFGEIDATLYNEGKVDLASSLAAGGAQLLVMKDYTESDSAVLAMSVTKSETTKMMITGKATLCGTLEIELAEQARLEIGASWSILSAGEVLGRFANDTVKGSDGTQISIHYSETEVILRVESLGAMNRVTSVGSN